MDKELALAVDGRRLQYDHDYREELVLPGGQHVRFRAVQPSDKHRLQEGLQKLSADAVMARFFSVKRRFTRDELRYLTEFDGIDHYAIGVVLRNDDGSEGEGIGVGRIVRDSKEPRSAEPAVVVLDAWQGKGLGKAIFERLVEAARERGIRYFHAEFLPGNDGILRLLEGICPELMVWRRGEILVADVPLPDASDAVQGECARNVFATLLRMAAQKLIRIRVGGGSGGAEPAAAAVSDGAGDAPASGEP